MNSIVIRDVITEDIKQLQQISIQTFLETFSAYNSKENMDKYFEEALSIEKLSEELKRVNSQFYFATINDRVIGYLKVNYGSAQTELTEENSFEIERIYVLREFLGKKVGQQLYNKALEIATKKNVAFIWLGVWEKNERAIHFYKKNGFIEFDKHIFKLGDDEQIDIMMKQELPIKQLLTRLT